MRNHLAVCAQQSQAPVEQACSLFAFLPRLFLSLLLAVGIAPQATLAASARADGQVAAQGAQAGKPVPLKPKTERYDIEVEFQPEKGFLRATAKVTLRAVEPMKAVVMELSRYLQILDVTDGKGRKLEATRGGRIGSHTVVVALTEPIPANEEFAITFRYEGVLPRGPLDYITKDGILLRDESRWYPAVDLSAFAMNVIRVKLPAGWESVSPNWKTSAVSSRAIVALQGKMAISRDHAFAGRAGFGPRSMESTSKTVQLMGPVGALLSTFNSG